jgi:hypothetical protein
MRRAIIILAAFALAATAFAGENTGKIIKTKFAGPGDGQPFEAVINDDFGNPLMDIKCSELERGEKDVKIYWLDPEHMPKAEAEFQFTWSDKIEDCVVESNCVGLAQFQNFFVEGGATITMRIVFVGHVANRIGLGVIKPEYIIPVANRPGAWDSVINTKGIKGKREGGIVKPKYLDLTEYGAKVKVDTEKHEATLTWVYEPDKGFHIWDGQLDIGLVSYQK